MRRLCVLCAVMVLVGACTGEGSSDVIATSSTLTSTSSSTTSPTPVSPSTTSAASGTKTTAAPVTTTPEPAPVVEVGALTTWVRISDDAGVFGQGSWLEAVTAFGDGFVAVGPSGAWWSGDGVVWEAATMEDLPPGAWVADVTDGPLGLVAVGAVELDGRRKSAVWMSSDGQDWVRIPHDEASFGSGGSGMEGVTYGGPGLVAVGNVCPDVERTCPGIPAVWTSPDGVTWDRTLLDGIGGINDVVSVDGRLVGAGTLHNGDDSDAALWVSRDAVTWDRVGQTIYDELAFGGAGDQWISQIVASDNILVAAGATYDSDSKVAQASIWFAACPDLESTLNTAEGDYCWTWFRPDGNAYAEGVAANDSGFVVVGYAEGDPATGLIWTSTDKASNWELVSEGSHYLFGLVEAHHPDAATDLETAAIEAGANEVEPLTHAQNDDVPENATGARFIADRTAIHTVSKWLSQNGWAIITSE